MTKQQQFLLLRNLGKAIATKVKKDPSSKEDGSPTTSPENSFSNMWTNINESFDTEKMAKKEREFHQAAGLLV